MRTKITNDQLTVLGVAGTHVVVLGMSLPKAKAKGLRGFGILRTDHATGERTWIRGLKTFEGVGNRDTRVADIYIGEFMRLYSHHAFREFLARTKPGIDQKFRHLDPTDAWTKDYYEDNGTARQARQKYFAGL